MVDDERNGTASLATLSLLDSGEQVADTVDGPGGLVGGPATAPGEGEDGVSAGATASVSADELGGATDFGRLGQASTLRVEEEVAEYDIEKKLGKSKIKERLFRKPPAPMRVGRFIVLEKLGAGAMGEVYSAYDEQLDRKVALKLVRPELAAKSQKASQRLIREAQTQARLSHPNVVHVYEAGMFQGRVFLAMEFIRGQNLREWLENQTDLPAGKRWRLVIDKFIDAGNGLKAAHAAGLVHRDFKPGNVLVGAGDGRVCVADFGLARKVESELGDGEPAEIDPRDEVTLDPDRPLRKRAARRGRPLRTQAELATARGAIVGTPAYMSPEQFEGRTADARSDQYSFCVALYEALYGERPHQGNSFADLQASVLSGVFAPPPRISPVPTRIGKAIARGLARDPEERFADMEALLEALSGARSRRRRLGVGMGLAGAAAVLASVAVVALGGEREGPNCRAAGDSVREMWTAERAERVRAAFVATGLPYADELFTRARDGIANYVDSLAVERVNTCEATHVRHEQSQRLFTLTTLCIDRRQRQLETTLAHLANADKMTVEKSLQVLAALPPTSVCRDRETLMLGAPPPGDPKLAANVVEIRARLDEAYILWLTGQPRAAEGTARTQLSAAKATGFAPVIAEALAQMGRLLADVGDASESEQAQEMLLEAVDLADVHGDDWLVSHIWLELTVLAIRHHTDFSLGHLYARRALASAKRGGSIDSQGRALRQRGSLYAAEREFAIAERYQRQALDVLGSHGQLHASVAFVWHDLGIALAGQSKVDAARDAYEHAIEMFLNLFGPSSIYLARVYLDYGKLERHQAAFEHARTLLLKARTLFESAYGTFHVDLARIDNLLANLEQEAGQLDMAEMYALRARDVYERVLSDRDPKRANPEIVLAIVQFRRNRYGDAAASFERALRIQQRILGDDHVLTAETLSNLGETLVELRQCDQALARLDQARAIFDRNAHQYPMLGVWIMRGQGMAHLCKGEPHLARDMLAQVLAELRSHQGDPLERAGVMWALAQARRQVGDWPDAQTRSLAEEARSLFAAGGQAGSAQAGEIQAWLANDASAGVGDP